jgi:hypothetical protein
MSLRIERIGSDPEVFLCPVGSNEIMAAANILHGTKDEPLRSESGIAVHWDNVAAEINPLPAANEQEFIQNTADAVAFLEQQITPYGAYIDNSITRRVPEDVLSHPSCWEMGCDPDFDAWGLEMYSKPKKDSIGPLRHVGGHLHFSFSQTGKEDLRIPFIRALDLCIGVPSILAEQENTRRRMYGRAGRFRIPSDTRIEYRTPSNFWLFSKNYAAQKIWAAAEMARAMTVSKSREILELGPEIREAINNGNKAVAGKLVANFGLIQF